MKHTELDGQGCCAEASAAQSFCDSCSCTCMHEKHACWETCSAASSTSEMSAARVRRLHFCFLQLNDLKKTKKKNAFGVAFIFLF